MKQHAGKIEARDPRTLKPSPHNSRSHPAEQRAAIWESIKRFGITRPVLILPDGEIVAGHGVVETAIEHDLSSVPCRVLKGMSREEARAYILADNRLAEMSEWDKEALEADHVARKFSIAELRSIRDEYRARVKRMAAQQMEIAA